MFSRTITLAAVIAVLHAGSPCQTNVPGVSFNPTATPNGRQTVGIAVALDGTVYTADMRGLLRSSPDLSTWTEALTGYVRALAVGPAGEFYAATPDSVLRTTDKGLSWSLLRTGGPNDFFALAVTSAGSVFLGDRYGVLRSSTGDTAWTRVLAAGVVSSLLYMPATGALFAYEDSLIYSSTDSGSSWTARPLDSLDVFVYALAGDSAGNLFAGTSGAGVYRSTDRGESWHRLMNSLSTLDVVAVAADSAGRVYAGLRSGLLCSDDHGETWQVLSPSATVPQVYDIAVTSRDRLYAATAFGLLASSDRGVTWQMLAPRPGVDRIYQLSLAPDDWLYALTTAGVHRSHNGGSSWTPANEGFSAFIPSYLTVDPGGLLFGGAEGDNFRSTDNGSSWQRLSLGPVPDSAGVNDLLATPAGRLLAATNSGIFASADHGQTWSRVDSGLTNNARILSRAPDGTLYAGCLGSAIVQGTGAPPPAGTVYTSVDSGFHWRELSAWTSTSEPVEVTSFAFADSGALLAGTSTGSIFRSTDRGFTWAELFVGVQVSAMAVDSQSFCYAGGYASLYRSTDDGRSWLSYAPGVSYLSDPVTSIVVDKVGTMLFASGNRIYRSAVPLKEMPDAVALAAPADGGAAAPDSTRFTWRPSGPAVQRYWFEISRDTLFTASTVDSLLADTANTVRGLPLGTRWWWRVRAGNRMGWGPFSSIWSCVVGTDAADERPALPARYELHQNFPNPFNPTTSLRYDLPRESTVSLMVFNALGQQVLLLAEGRKPAGSYTVSIDGGRLPSGVYFCRLMAGPYRATRKIMLVK